MSREAVVAGSTTQLGRTGERLYLKCYLILFDNYLFLRGEITGHRLEA